MYKRYLLASIGFLSICSPFASSVQAENLNFLVQPIRAKIGDIVVGARGDLALSGGFGEDVAVELGQGEVYSLGFKREGFVELFASKGRSTGSKLAAAIGFIIDNDDGSGLNVDNIRLRVEAESGLGRVALGHVDRVASKNFDIDDAVTGLSTLNRNEDDDFIDDLAISAERRVGRWDVKAIASYDRTARLQVSTDRVLGKTFGWFGLEAAYDDVRSLGIDEGALNETFKRGLTVAGVADFKYGSTQIRGRAEVARVLDDPTSGLKSELALAASHKFDRLTISAGALTHRNYEEDIREVQASVGASYDIGTNLSLVAGASYRQIQDLQGANLMGEEMSRELKAEGGLQIMF